MSRFSRPPARRLPLACLSACALVACGPSPQGPTEGPSPSPTASLAPTGSPSQAASPSPSGASLSGRVFDAAGLPVAGATVRVLGHGAATSGSDGAYRLEGLPTLANLSVAASAPGRPERTRVVALVPGPNGAVDFGRAAPVAPLPFPIPLALAEADANFLAPGLELRALAPTQEGVASAAFATELRFAFSEALSTEGAQRFSRMARLWPGDEPTANGQGPVHRLHERLRFGEAAPSLVAPWAIAHGTNFRGQSAFRAEVLVDPDRRGGRFRLPFPLPNTVPGASYQFGLLADEGPILSEGGQALGALALGEAPKAGVAGEVLRAVVLDEEATLAAAPALSADAARRLGRLRPSWRFQLPPDRTAPKLVDATALADGEDLVFKLRFDEPLVVFDPIASEAGGRAHDSLRGAGDRLAAFGFAFAEKAGELDGILLEGEPSSTWDPIAEAEPAQRKAELRLAASALVVQWAGSPTGSVLMELPPAAPTELWLRVRGRGQALRAFAQWAVRVGGIADPVGQRRSKEQANAEVLRQAL